MSNQVSCLLLVLALLSSVSAKDSAFFEKFKDDYSQVDRDLLNHAGEVGEISNFVYKKDVATFTFHEGTVHMLRYIDGRPTTVIFVGRGTAHVEVPPHVEQQSMKAVTGRPDVDEDFDVCLIRMADNFDERLRQEFTFGWKELDWKTFNAAKKAQGEQFFKPSMQHRYDNFFQLLRSHYERAEDGFFFIDFNRYTFTFDPNRPEEVIVGFEFEGGDFVITEAAVFQRQEEGIYDDQTLSPIKYETTTLSKHAVLEMGGLDGTHVSNGQGTMELLVNADSVRYVTAFLHFNLKIDSVYYRGQRAGFHRRNDFSVLGVLLPEYVFRGDTIELTLWYRGRECDYTLPYVDNPSAAVHVIDFVVPEGFDYYMPGTGPTSESSGRHEKFSTTPSNPYRRFYFDVFASGIDTIPEVSDIGITLNFLKSEHINKKNYQCFIPDDIYRSTALEAFNYFSGILGAPPGAFAVFVYPESFLSMPGLMELPQVACVREGTMVAVGGFHAYAGYAASRQWFGALLRPASERELWLCDALPAYLAGMATEKMVGAGEFYSGMLARRDTILTEDEKGHLRPLATGERVNRLQRANKGAWLMHMLRFLMTDLESSSDRAFLRFLQEAALTFNNKTFTNQDFADLARKHYGKPLDWFFRYWLYDWRYPKFDVVYSVAEREDGYYLVAEVQTQNVDDDFQMPVIIQVRHSDGNSSFHHPTVTGVQSSFEVGPFQIEPTELVFNEFFSVLAKDNVNRK